MGQHVLPSAFQTNKATRSPCEEGPVSHPHSGNKAFPLQRCKWPSLPCPRKQKSGLTWPLWMSAHVQRSKGGGGALRCSQSKEWSRLDAICHCAKWQVAVHKESSQVDSFANTLSLLAFSQLLSTTSLCVEVGSFCGPGLGATTVVRWRGKGRGPGMRPFLNDSVYRRTGLVLGRDAVWFSESSPEKSYLH